jgi:3-deoxy-D-manno-octulosonic acid (KDO) 8-phosphate synthase
MHQVLEKLKIQLELQEWPDVYMFKFIVPNQSDKVAQVTALFNNSTDIVMHPSKTGKYISVTAKELMLDVNSILVKYEEAALIEGLIAL